MSTRVGERSKDLSSYEVDTDADAEQRLADAGLPVKVNGEKDEVPILHSTLPHFQQLGSTDYDQLLSSVGLTNSVHQVTNLPKDHVISNRDVYCNRELRMSAIRSVGFDMDHTLAQYIQPAFDLLGFEGAKEKLVKVLGYPEAVMDFKYDHTYWIRGLIIDKERGNFIKIDRHKYVRVAYHGFTPISSLTRKHLYSREFNKVPSFTEKSYVNMDTLFQHVDAHLFAHLVELKDNGEYDVLDAKTYEEMYTDVRACVDLCHRDGVIKDIVAQRPEDFIRYDKDLVPMLKNFRNDGVKLFLLTNSFWEYTVDVMNFLYHGRKVDDELKAKNEWMELFDVVIVGSGKPGHFTDANLSLFRINPKDGSLLNTDGLFEMKALGGADEFLKIGKTFQGGNWRHLQGLLEVEAGEEILYVGDHLYADVLRSKRSLGWRSAFIVPELEEEMRVFNENLELHKQITSLRRLRDELATYGDKVRREEDLEDAEVQKKLAEIELDDNVIKQKLTSMAAVYHSTFHPVWGQIFHAGYQDSRFAFFVQNYACLYTSRATNLGLASTTRSFRTTIEMLPHDKMLSSLSCEFQSIDDEE